MKRIKETVWLLFIFITMYIDRFIVAALPWLRHYNFQDVLSNRKLADNGIKRVAILVFTILSIKYIYFFITFACILTIYLLYLVVKKYSKITRK